MKEPAWLIILWIAISTTVFAQQTVSAPAVAVPDEATAVRLAEMALTKVYGQKTIEAERPFKAMLRDDVWHVAGTLYCRDEHGKVVEETCDGGVAMAEVRRRDGRVLKTTHTK